MFLVFVFLKKKTKYLWTKLATIISLESVPNESLLSDLRSLVPPKAPAGVTASGSPKRQ